MPTDKIKVKELSVGTTLEDNIYTADGKTLLLKKGISLTKETIDGLLNRGIETVWVLKPECTSTYPQQTDSKGISPDDVTFSFPESLEERLFLIFDGRPILKLDDPAVNRTKKEAIKTAHKLLESVSQSLTVNTSDAVDTAREIMNAITVNHQAFINIAGVKEHDEYTFEHSVDVATYTTIIAKEYGIHRDSLVSLCAGALLHDVGKMLVDPEILNKPGKLTDEEFEVMKTHSEKGYNLLRENDVEEEVAFIAHGHHERCDGMGYPQGLKNGSMPESIQMAAIADVYDALTSDRVYKKAIDVSKAMQIIVSSSGKQFNPDLVSVFQRTIGIYPIGSLVKLNNDFTARVLEQNKGIVRPVIQLLTDKEGNELEDKKVIDLMDNDELFIRECLRD
jgi:putative nucleotidyltransferase with HDIG domain